MAATMSTLDAALDLAQRGFHVIPIIPGEKYPPITKWQDHATVDPTTITEWWTTKYTNYGIGIAPRLRATLNPESSQQRALAFRAPNRLAEILCRKKHLSASYSGRNAPASIWFPKKLSNEIKTNPGSFDSWNSVD